MEDREVGELWRLCIIEIDKQSKMGDFVKPDVEIAYEFGLQLIRKLVEERKKMITQEVHRGITLWKDEQEIEAQAVHSFGIEAKDWRDK